MKNIEKKKIKNIIKAIDPTIKICFGSRFLECDPVENIIYIPNRYYNKDTRVFKEWYKKHFNEKLTKRETKLVSILHEVGHILTYDEDISEERELNYSLLKLMFECGILTTKELNTLYFENECELNATKWAREYMKELVKN